MAQKAATQKKVVNKPAAKAKPAAAMLYFAKDIVGK